jgi:dimethylaniline monooxygenase (N-oxide forming)
MQKKSLAIIGAGSSGLITLKTALDHLPNWEIQCFERNSNIRGCWGSPYKGFVSTSTKFTTQFSCHRKYDANVFEKGSYDEFFKDGEYGEYLEDFAKTNNLNKSIQLNTEISKIRRINNEWKIEFSDTIKSPQTFTHVTVCTGLTERPKEVQSIIPTLYQFQNFSSVRDKTIVVIGGGESAADTANRLAKPELNNRVYLSLKQGIRVSPRYHPIRGVPSDFLRNRLMLSIRAKFRNTIGQTFVESRIRYQHIFERIFPHAKKQECTVKQSQKKIRRHWDMLLTKSAKDQLFNVFHNKSDGFLDAIGEERIKIIGTSTDQNYSVFNTFQQDQEIHLQPDLLIPKLGFQSGLPFLFVPPINVSDFHLGCIHKDYENLFLVGFARPIIGNIPTISEQQAKYIIKLLDGSLTRPADVVSEYQAEREQLSKQFSNLNLNVLYPVEMFPYCDTLAKKMATYPSLKKVGSLRRWLRIMLSPASTIHYIDEDYDPESINHLPIHTPPLINSLLFIVKLFDLMSKPVTTLRSKNLFRAF